MALGILSVAFICGVMCDPSLSCLQDVATRILSFSQKGPRSICILSANGAISNVTLRQPGSSGGTLTYEVKDLEPIVIFCCFIEVIGSYMFFKKCACNLIYLCKVLMII